MLVSSASLRCQILDRDEATRQLQSKNASLDRKCERLRDYIRRLTSKCEEWATCYEEQSQLLTRVDGERRQSKQQDANTKVCHRI
jgi:predicted RNase H-like nuclease (RuvC/YqgF family)